MMQMDVSTQQVASTMAMVVLPQSVWEGMKSDIQDMKELLIKRNKEEDYYDYKREFVNNSENC